VWDPKRLYETKAAVVVKEAPRPIAERPTVTKKVDNSAFKSPRRRRKDNLALLGFASYKAYLRSSLWQQIRATVVLRAGGVCEGCCKVPLTVVHHVDYDIETLRGERPDRLIASCHRCHDLWHVKTKTRGYKKRFLFKPSKRLRKLMRDHRHPQLKAVQNLRVVKPNEKGK
jgi:hypothetical protein